MTLYNLSSIDTKDVMLLSIAVVTAWNARQSGKIKATGEAVHVLSNSAMQTQLTLNVTFASAVAVLAHRLASITQAEGDIAAATAADLQVQQQHAILQDHIVKQSKVDALK